MFRVDCIVCGNLSKTNIPVCSNCVPKTISLNRSCSVCGIETSIFVETCPSCMQQNKFCIKNYSLFSYQGLSKAILREYKFKKDYRFAKYYGDLIIYYIKNNFSNPVLCTIPTSYLKRVLNNGYQLDPLISYIKKYSGIRVLQIIGKHMAKTQKKLNKEERFKNLDTKFYLKKRVPTNCSIILLDDVYTTGSTIEAASKLLSKYNKSIYSITLARD